MGLKKKGGKGSLGASGNRHDRTLAHPPPRRRLTPTGLKEGLGPMGGRGRGRVAVGDGGGAGPERGCGDASPPPHIPKIHPVCHSAFMENRVGASDEEPTRPRNGVSALMRECRIHWYSIQSLKDGPRAGVKELLPPEEEDGQGHDGLFGLVGQRRMACSGLGKTTGIFRPGVLKGK